MSTVDTVFPPNEKWAWRALTPWRQETQGWLDEESGTYYPPTFAWFADFKGKRVKAAPRAEYFYVRVQVQGEEGKPLDNKVAKLTLENGAAEFDSYAECECTLDKKCKQHGGPDGL